MINIANWNWDKIANISVVIGIFIAIFTFINSNKQFKESLKLSEQISRKDSILFAKQLEISQDPIIRILPENEISGDIANFNLHVKNYGISELENIQIFVDYFVALSQKSKEITLISFGTISTAPNTYISTLKANEINDFTISFSSTLKQMSDFYSSPNLKGQRMELVRFIIKYDRKIDGKRYI